MRLVVDSLMALILAGVLAGVLWHQERAEEFRRDMETLRANVRIIQQQVMLQAALEQVPRNQYGFPDVIDPAWFGEPLPRNPLVGMEHSWLEIASPGRPWLHHPPDLVADGRHVAGFWYNPANGQVRARVPHLVSDQRTLETYNFVNGANLTDLFSHPALVGAIREWLAWVATGQVAEG